MFSNPLDGAKNLMQKVTGGSNPAELVTKGIKTPPALSAAQKNAGKSFSSSIGGMLGSGQSGKNTLPQIPPAPKLATFIEKLKTNSVSRQSHFYTSFTIPTSMGKSMIGKEKVQAHVETVNLYIEQTSLPELALATVANPATGVNTEMPYEKMFGQVTMTFVCDQRMTVKSFFDRWIFSTMQTAGGVFEYYDKYRVKELPIVITDANLNPVYMVVLYNAYPKLVNDVYLASNGRDYNRVQVQFSYSQWRSFTIEQTPQTLAKSNSIVPGVIKQIAGMLGISANFDSIPGIDQIGVGNVLEMIGKIGTPGGVKGALLKQGAGILSEMGKSAREKIMEALPGSVRQVGGSAMGQVGSMVMKKFF